MIGWWSNLPDNPGLVRAAMVAMHLELPAISEISCRNIQGMESPWSDAVNVAKVVVLLFLVHVDTPLFGLVTFVI